MSYSSPSHSALTYLIALIIVIAIIAIIIVAIAYLVGFGFKLAYGQPSCVDFSDGKVAMINENCPRDMIIKSIEWFMDKGYTLDAVTNAEGLPDYIWMTRK